ncbi:MAG: MmcQ/YjbR family DNA-binding protein [Clostridia bacterium]|nr:MmcQ/YjbR family DNA-binding protein [Clostridia bacterium]
MSVMRNEITACIKTKYGALPERLWMRFPDYTVFRHADNQKWFAVIMDVPKARLGLEGDGPVDILNVKVADPFFADLLTGQKGIFRAYHMDRRNWVSILLDGTVPADQIYGLLEESYLATASGQSREKARGPKDWLVPANPKYYDIVHAFDEAETIRWKQGAGIREGDTVYVYVGAPVSAILYRCRVTETNIPYRYTDENLTIKALMTIKLEKRFAPDRFTFDVLKSEYGVFAVRGPRGLPNRLKAALQKEK